MERKRVCPVENSGSLDNKLRKWIQNPEKLLAEYISPGMSVLDFGCGPGFFIPDMAKLTGDGGKVIAADIQDGMLSRVEKKIRDTEFQHIVELHQSSPESTGILTPVHFILAFYVLHEVPDPKRLLAEFFELLEPGGKILVVEPKGHVSQMKFRQTASMAEDTGFEIHKGPRITLSRSMVLIRN